jgi:hypothetical protein
MLMTDKTLPHARADAVAHRPEHDARAREPEYLTVLALEREQADPSATPVAPYAPGPRTGSKYANETIRMTEFGANWDRKNLVAVFAPAQLEGFRAVAFSCGRLVYAQSGQRIHCEFGIYVMDEHGNVYVHESPTLRGVHHSSLAGGKAPAAAGQLRVNDGIIEWISDNTHHYGKHQRPGTVFKVQRELQDQRVDTSLAEILECPKDGSLPPIPRLRPPLPPRTP